MSKMMPVLFVGHGNPMNAVEDNEFSRTWAEVGKRLPRPRAILCVSAHWETRGSRLTAMPAPATLHDFYGFPQPLYEMRYPAPGDPGLARSIQQAVSEPDIQLDTRWGLDHGTWSVLCRMFPSADIPVVQLSLDVARPPADHYRLGEKLKFLRGRDILVMGSGNMVHNLGVMAWDNSAFDWAQDFDALLATHIREGRHRPLIDYASLGEGARLAIPTNEHFLPLLYVLALQEESDAISFFCEKVTLGSISMRSFLLE
jgi:4,5-DOPA dioxygenase extradiol